jgi:2-methylcitrate dehydratase
MATTADFAEFIQSLEYSDLSEEVREEIKKRILDSVGIALGSIGDKPVEIFRETVTELDPEGGPCGIWGSDETASAPEATMMNTALTRYLDYMDSILLPGETPHPSDNVATAVATGQLVDASGRDLITSVGLAYEVQGELAAKAPGRDIGWDHIHVVFSSTAAACKMLDLDFEQSQNAMGIATASSNPLRVIRTGEISMWKGIASANMARNGVYTAMLARNGMEGPLDAVDGQKGWTQIVQSGREFDLEFTPAERVLDVMTKKYMAGTHAQAAIEGVEELVIENEIDPHGIERIGFETYESAKHVMGGGEGDRHAPENREQADHSIPYTVAVNAIDGQIFKPQYTLERIKSDDVRRLLRTVEVEENPELTERFNEHGEMAYNVTVETAEGDEYYTEKRDYEGHPHNRMSWEQHEAKFHGIADIYDAERRNEIIDVIQNLESHDVSDLTDLLNA